MSTETSFWKRCSSCKSDIEFATVYWVCSVSTCTRKRTGMVFCSVSCWEIHLPMMRHREAYAVEKRSPGRDRWIQEQREEKEKAAAAATSSGSTGGSTGSSEPAVVKRRVAAPAPAAATGGEVAEEDLPRDILIVASKLKKYIRARSGMNTSDGVMMILSDHVREICKQAIRNAGEDGRKTVLDRDIPRPRRIIS